MDYANTMTSWSKCLNENSKKITAKSFAVQPHPFNYKIKHDTDLNDLSEKEWIDVKDYISNCEVVFFAEEGYFSSNTVLNKNIPKLFCVPEGKKLILRHPGSTYRSMYKKYNNEKFRESLHKVIYSQDLYRLSPKHEKDIPMRPMCLFSFNRDEYIKEFRRKIDSNKYITFHNPSNRNKKGSDDIERAFSKARYDKKKIQLLVKQGLSNEESKILKSKCLFYVDQFETSIGGFGVSAIEALSSCCVVMSSTNNTVHSEGIVSLGRSFDSLVRSIESCLNMTNQELYDYAENAADVIEQHYSPDAVCKKLEKIILE